MPKRILIDATHVEETRVVLLENGRVQEFDSETSVKKQLKGNVYLAKITRVEPSLQAAFVEYGGDKHGFLPFSEIHPNYYNIPTKDKEDLLKSIRAEDTADEDDDSKSDAVKNNQSDSIDGNQQASEPGKQTQGAASLNSENDNSANSSKDNFEDGFVENVGNFDDKENDIDLAVRNSNIYKKYKIQEVIKRNQVLLVQVDKEERGNKGASLTTFISLAGRYSVLMPNSLRKGGVSRKIGSIEDRKRLKRIISELNIPEDSGIIVRTAGSTKSDKEIKNDYEYLSGVWNQIVGLTVTSSAPAFIHEESSIIRRTMRDMYDDEVKEVLIEGDETFKAVKDFIQKVMPDHSANIKQYKNKVPIFSRYKVEEQIAALFRASVNLESGGSIVIDPTEALISIDVNSGKSTGQKSVEDTALSTNLEAAAEIARQLRLRDLSGLIVIDFIDMVELKNRKAVERVLKESFRDDRAKIQVGRISTFGLLEMSRQRMRASFLEVNTQICRSCSGSGFVKATETIAVNVLRGIEDQVSRGSKSRAVEVSMTTDVAIYILNHKRKQLTAIEERYTVGVLIRYDNSLPAEEWRVNKVSITANESDKDDETNVSAVAENAPSAEVIAFPEKRRGRAKDDTKKDKSAKREITVGTILNGLWQKIIE